MISCADAVPLPRTTPFALDSRPYQIASSSVANGTQIARGGAFGARTVGVVQMVGGALEIALGVGGVATPTGITQVGGVILITHGADTFVAGFRSIFTGEVQRSFTEQGASAAATSLGASPQTAQYIGAGADLVAGVGPSITIGVARRLAIASAGSASERVAIAYLHRSALEVGHNAVGIRQGGRTAWIHFAGKSPGRVLPMVNGPGASYRITELAVTTEQAGRATAAGHTLVALGPQEWALFGPNCVTTVRTVLQASGIAVPAWSQTPFLLYLGVTAGPEITIVGGTAAALGPPVGGGGR